MLNKNISYNFIELEPFTKYLKEHEVSDFDLMRLQNELIERKDEGLIIVGTGGLQKIRMSVGNRGKRGSARVIYLLIDQTFYLVYAYSKNTKDDLSAAEKNTLKGFVTALRKSHK